MTRRQQRALALQLVDAHATKPLKASEIHAQLVANGMDDRVAAEWAREPYRRLGLRRRELARKERREARRKKRGRRGAYGRNIVERGWSAGYVKDGALVELHAYEWTVHATKGLRTQRIPRAAYEYVKRKGGK